MLRSVTGHGRRRLLSRLAVVAAALVSAGAVSIAATQPASAATCATNGHVYLTSVSPASFRFEDQPIAGGTDNYQMFAGGAPSFRVGGNGLRPGTTPHWTIVSNVTGPYVFFGRPAGSNCVANENTVGIPRSTTPGEVWTVTANYNAGNSGRFIQNQAHFQISFVAPPPPPPEPDSPYTPCYYAEACL